MLLSFCAFVLSSMETQLRTQVIISMKVPTKKLVIRLKQPETEGNSRQLRLDVTDFLELMYYVMSLL